MNPIEGLSVAALRTAVPPAWLAPWIRPDFSYALVQPVFNALESSDAPVDESDALMALVAGLSSGAARWYLVSSPSGLAPPWQGAGMAPTSAAAAATEVATARRANSQIAVVVTPPTGPPPGSLADILARADLVLVVLGRWDGAVIGARNVLTEARSIGAHIGPDTMDPPQLVDHAVNTEHSRAGRSRMIATGVAVAAVIAGGLVAWHRTPHQAAESASPVPTRSSQPGLLLPAATRFPGGRTGASASFDPLTGSVTLFGGGRLGGDSQSDLFPRDTWTWDVNGWQRRNTTDAPPAVSDSAFAYDEGTGSAILFGGIGGDGGTWRWDGLNWHRLNPTRHPEADVFASAVFDPRRHAVVLATVCCQTSPAGTEATVQTWEWRHDDWVPLRGRGAPVSSRAPLITYDTARGRLLLLTQGSTPVSDNTDRVTTTSTLWSFDGVAWRHAATPLSPPYDPIRDRLGYDPASRQVVLFQGGDLPTWTWDGSTWHEKAAGGPLYSGAMSADATVGRIVLFGGQVPSDDLSAVWTLDSGRWKRVSGR